MVEENIAFLFVYLPLCPWGNVLTLVGGSSCLGAQAGCGTTEVGPLPATDSQPTSSQPQALSGVPSSGIFLLPLSSTAPFSSGGAFHMAPLFQELVWGSSPPSHISYHP